jgi:hypothetical protein
MAVTRPVREVRGEIPPLLLRARAELLTRGVGGGSVTEDAPVQGRLAGSLPERAHRLFRSPASHLGRRAAVWPARPDAWASATAEAILKVPCGDMPAAL